MNARDHIRKIESLEKSALKLNEEDYEALVEIYMLISAHYINVALHELDVIKQNTDIKHNQMFSFLKEGDKLGRDTELVRDSMKKLDELRPSHVYGKGENGETENKAKSYYKNIKKACEEIIKNER